jgi:hypothetical protein
MQTEQADVILSADTPGSVDLEFLVYPNPVQQSVFRYALTEPSEVNLTIYDLSGTIIREYELGRMQAGVQEYRPGNLELVKGVYVAEINTQAGSQRIRIVSN